MHTTLYIIIRHHQRMKQSIKMSTMDFGAHNRSVYNVLTLTMTMMTTITAMFIRCC